MNVNLDLNNKNVLEFCAYQTLKNQRTCNNNIINCKHNELFNKVVELIESPLIAAKILDDLKSVCNKEQKLKLLQIVLKSDNLSYIIKNTIFDKYIIKEMINSNVDEQVLLTIVQKYIRDNDDLKFFTNRCNKDVIKSIMLLIKLEGETK